MIIHSINGVISTYNWYFGPEPNIPKREPKSYEQISAKPLENHVILMSFPKFEIPSNTGKLNYWRNIYTKSDRWFYLKIRYSVYCSINPQCTNFQIHDIVYSYCLLIIFQDCPMESAIAGWPQHFWLHLLKPQDGPEKWFLSSSQSAIRLYTIVMN
jgi:hypothetical protein